MNIYVDETIHDAHGFMMLAYVICQSDPQTDLARILEAHRADELHASERMHGNEQAQKLRAKFKDYINKSCRWGVFVLPSSARWSLADEMPGFLSQLVGTFSSDNAVSVCMDQGVVKEKDLKRIRDGAGIGELHLCRSHEVNGIQLADLVAALCGVRLREEMGQEPKILEYGPESGFHTPIMAALGWELWAALRYSMHRGAAPVGDDLPEMAEFSTMGYGLFVSDKCSAELVYAAEKLFGRVYLGCIH